MLSSIKAINDSEEGEKKKTLKSAENKVHTWQWGTSN